METGKRNADLGEWGPKIRKLAEDFEESDTELEECDTENEIGELPAEIDNLTAELEERDRKIGKLQSELGECDAKIKERDRKITKLAAETRRLNALLGDRDSSLRKLNSELAKCDATIRLFTVELGERHTKIGELTAEVSDCDRKLRKYTLELEDRDAKIREHKVEIRRLSELLEHQDAELRRRDATIKEVKDLEVGERDAAVDELSAAIDARDRKINELAAELEEYKAKMRKCSEEHRKGDGELANVTLDPDTAHPRLVLSPDRRSVRWEYREPEAPDAPRSVAADPCVLGSEAFTSGHHYWDVDVTGGFYCAVGVSRERRECREGGSSFSPGAGVWAVQQWGFQNRALTSPPTLLRLPRVPRRIRVSLDYEWGQVAFSDAESRAPIFTFPPAAFAGERLRPWFWLELGSLALVR